MQTNVKIYGKRLLYALLIMVVLYSGGRLYYFVTDGFRIANITSDLEYDPRWETRPLSDEENGLVERVLAQEFRYLGKGCQSYVFQSEDGDYVLKFFKYQRMRPKDWLKPLAFLPYVEDYIKAKNAKKKRKLEGVFGSWKIAFDHVSKETGVIYVHLNKTNHLKRSLTIHDKVGITHTLNIDDYEFMIQKKATMLCDYIDELMASDRFEEAKTLLQNLVNGIIDGYQRGIADNDHALMQNTGVFNGEPILIDVGQFAVDESIKDPSFHMQELYTKTFKFRIWLRETYPDLCNEFDRFLQDVIGDDFETMQPFWRQRIEIFQ